MPNKFVKTTLLLAGGIGFVYLVAFCANKRPSPPFTSRLRSRNGKYRIPKDWKGTPGDSKGRFLNYQEQFYQNYVDILKWIPSHAINLIKNRSKKFEVFRLEPNDLFKQDNILVWLGHSSFFIKVSGTTFLIDPHFHNMFPYKRHTENPISPEYFSQIDYILISHDHADHLDKKSIKQIVLQNPSVVVLTGLKMDTIIQRYTGLPNEQIICADWFEQYPISNKNLFIHFVPSRHYSKRVDTNFNNALWGGFIIEYLFSEGKKTIFFGGDSGYSNHYKMIKDEFKPDIAIIGIGAYSPHWFMEPNHMNPDDVYRAFEETGATKLIPTHYLTFNLSNENMSEPLEKIKLIAGDSLQPLKIGEIYSLLA